MAAIWLNDWDDSNIRKLEKVFGLKNQELNDIELLLASYRHDDSSGYAFILFSLNSKLYEVNASHDSELEFISQWQPEETSIEALLFRLYKGNLGLNNAGEDMFASALQNILKSMMQ